MTLCWADTAAWAGYTRRHGGKHREYRRIECSLCGIALTRRCRDTGSGSDYGLKSEFVRHFSQVRLFPIAALCTLLVYGCSNASRKPTESTCIVPYAFRVPGGSIDVGSCAGVLPSHARSVAIRIGDRFSVRIATQGTGRHLYPLPTSSTPAVVQTGHLGARVSFLAKTRGKSTLAATNTSFCATSSAGLRTCPLLIVHVSRP